MTCAGELRSRTGVMLVDDNDATSTMSSYLVIKDETRSSNVQIVHGSLHLVIDGVATYQAACYNENENTKTKNSCCNHFGFLLDIFCDPKFPLTRYQTLLTSARSGCVVPVRLK